MDSAFMHVPEPLIQRVHQLRLADFAEQEGDEDQYECHNGHVHLDLNASLAKLLVSSQHSQHWLPCNLGSTGLLWCNTIYSIQSLHIPLNLASFFKYRRTSTEAAPKALALTTWTLTHLLWSRSAKMKKWRMTNQRKVQVSGILMTPGAMLKPLIMTPLILWCGYLSDSIRRAGFHSSPL